MSVDQKHNHVIVVGGGFGGVYAVKELLKKGNKVTLISRTNSFTFTPLLAEVATGNLAPRDVTFEYTSFFNNKNFTFVRGCVNAINVASNSVSIDSENLTYDYLVVATGATTNFFGAKGAEYAYTLKSVDDANKIRKRVLQLAQSIGKDVTVTIVGGGPTGVELAGEMDQFLHDIEKYNRDVVCHVRLIEARDSLIGMFDPTIQKYAEKKLNEMGVSAYLNERVEEIKEDAIITNKEEYPTSIVIWTAGVKASSTLVPQEYLDERGHVLVDKTLLIKGTKNVYAIGDIISLDGEQVPKLAQTAVDEACVVAQNISGRVRGGKGAKEYSVELQGKLISIGKWQGAGEVFGLKMKGPHMWLLWRAVYFFKNPGIRNKFETGFSWFINMFTGRILSE